MLKNDVRQNEIKRQNAQGGKSMQGNLQIVRGTLHLHDLAANPHRSALDGFSRIRVGGITFLSVGVIDWIPLVFPAWVLLVSTHILIENLR